jgi:hypothetical protein
MVYSTRHYRAVRCSEQDIELLRQWAGLRLPVVGDTVYLSWHREDDPTYFLDMMGIEYEVWDHKFEVNNV